LVSFAGGWRLECFTEKGRDVDPLTHSCLRQGSSYSHVADIFVTLLAWLRGLVAMGHFCIFFFNVFR
jgi:hypothetical protein